MARIAVDMDEVIADAFGEHIRRYNEMFGASVEKLHVVGKHLRDIVPVEHRQATNAIVFTHDFFEDLEVMPGAQEVLEQLNRDHEVFIVTAAMEVPNSLASKYRWLQRHFPFISPLNYVFCGHKYMIAADYLIDDNARHFKKFPGEGILFDAHHNQHVTGYRRVHNWHEVAELFAGVPV
jgi:5'(3')-deoxyribonucleotidase